MPAQTVVDDLVTKSELSLTDPPSGPICQVATMLSRTRDPFDRLISAQAVTTKATLVTNDQSIRRNLSLAWWSGDDEA